MLLKLKSECESESLSESSNVIKIVRVRVCEHTWYLSFFYTHTFSGLKILLSKVRKFATKIAPRQYRVHQYWDVKFKFIVLAATLNKLNYTVSVKLHGVCKITQCVCKIGKNSSQLKNFTLTPWTAWAANISCGCLLYEGQNLITSFTLQTLARKECYWFCDDFHANNQTDKDCL